MPIAYLPVKADYSQLYPAQNQPLQGCFCQDSSHPIIDLILAHTDLLANYLLIMMWRYLQERFDASNSSHTFSVSNNLFYLLV